MRLRHTLGGWSAQVLVLRDHWVDAAVVASAIAGRVPGRPARTFEEACAAAVAAAGLPAFARAARGLDHRHLVEVCWWDAVTEGAPRQPGLLVLEVAHNYFDEQLFATIWDSIAADRDAHWELDLTPDQATEFAHALWLASGGELAREPVRIGPLALLPMFGDRCELRVLDTTEHPKLLGQQCFLDLDLLVTLHATLRYLPRLFG
ncbi:hypothetical protein GCM10027436_80380 [Actinophytocola sediminis]